MKEQVTQIREDVSAQVRRVIEQRCVTTLFQPIFVDGVVRGFSGSKAHWNDVGAKDAGYVSDSTNIFQEGLRIPPIQLVRDGEIDPQLLDILRLNSRYPGSLVGDLMAQWEALQEHASPWTWCTRPAKPRGYARCVRSGAGRLTAASHWSSKGRPRSTGSFPRPGRRSR